jgi:hypothetical protein
MAEPKKEPTTLNEIVTKLFAERAVLEQFRQFHDALRDPTISVGEGMTVAALLTVAHAILQPHSITIPKIQVTLPHKENS